MLWSSPSVAGFSIYADRTGKGVLLGTSDKGRVYEIGNDGHETLVLQSDAGQISTLVSQGNNLFATSSNQGSLFKIGPETVAEGTYESSVLDAKSSASWGRIWWRVRWKCADPDANRQHGEPGGNVERLEYICVGRFRQCSDRKPKGEVFPVACRS